MSFFVAKCSKPCWALVGHGIAVLCLAVVVLVIEYIIPIPYWVKFIAFASIGFGAMFDFINLVVLIRRARNLRKSAR
jgi:hypothetical protein